MFRIIIPSGSFNRYHDADAQDIGSIEQVDNAPLISSLSVLRGSAHVE
jgi:hypothetical protein